MPASPSQASTWAPVASQGVDLNSELFLSWSIEVPCLSRSAAWFVQRPLLRSPLMAVLPSSEPTIGSVEVNLRTVTAGCPGRRVRREGLPD